MPLPLLRLGCAAPAARARRTGAAAWGRIIGALVLGLALQGCTAVKLAYNNLPELAYWWLDGYLDFNEQQTPRLREDLAQLLQWHRTNELPKYAQTLSKVEQMAQADTGPEQVCAVFSEVRGHIESVMDRSEPALTVMALETAPAQLDALRRKYAKKNAEFRREWLDVTPEERRERRLKQVLERSEPFYGRLDARQRDAVRRHIERSSFDPAVSHAEQLRRQQEVLAVFGRIAQSRPGLSEVRGAMRTLMRNQLESTDPAYRAYARRLQQEGCDSLAQLHNTTTPEQRRNAVRQLRSYETDVRELMAQR